jgi:hypothetical protein
MVDILYFSSKSHFLFIETFSLNYNSIDHIYIFWYHAWLLGMFVGADPLFGLDYFGQILIKSKKVQNRFYVHS